MNLLSRLVSAKLNPPLAATVCTMAFSSPPELLLRNAVRLMKQNGARLCATSSQRTYRASVCSELGKPLTLQDIPQQELDKGQVRIKVDSAAVNFADLLMVKGLYQEKPPLPFVPGSELAGEISEVGAGVQHLEPGQRVMGISTKLGGFAEQAVLDAKVVMPVPDNVDLSVASCFVVAYGTAYMALKQRANIQPGDVVLVTAAAGGTGLAAVELASKVFGAKVIGACGGPEKCALVKQFGAAEAIDYNKESIRERVKEITKGKGANIIFDAVGGKIMEECVRSLAFEGRLLVIGFASGDIPKIPSNLLLVKAASAIGVYWGSYSYRKPAAFAESIMAVMQYAAEGKIKPHISKTFPLHQANEAFDFIQQRKSTGKVVVKMT